MMVENANVFEVYLCSTCECNVIVYAPEKEHICPCGNKLSPAMRWVDDVGMVQAFYDYVRENTENASERDFWLFFYRERKNWQLEELVAYLPGGLDNKKDDTETNHETD